VTFQGESILQDRHLDHRITLRSENHTNTRESHQEQDHVQSTPRPDGLHEYQDHVDKKCFELYIIYNFEL